MTKLILENPLAPGDVLISTSAFRDLHKAYPGEYQTDFRVPTGCEQIFENNPYITKIADDDKEARRIRLDYDGIHRSGVSGLPFSTAHTVDLAVALGRPIPPTSLLPDIFLSQDEKLWPSPVMKEHGYSGKYWIINAGAKNDYTLKFYHRYQDVVDQMADRIQFVQVGQLEHNHPPLKGVLDMRGKTDLRALFRLSLHAQGAISPVSLQMVVMAALKKPCVVVAGGREPVRWQIVPNHRFLYVNGAIECAQYDGCWKNVLQGGKPRPDGSDPNCVNPVVPEFQLDAEKGRRVPLCMEMIRPEDIVRAVDLYYIGKMLEYERKEVNV